MLGCKQHHLFQIIRKIICNQEIIIRESKIIIYIYMNELLMGLYIDGCWMFTEIFTMDIAEEYGNKLLVGLRLIDCLKGAKF